MVGLTKKDPYHNLPKLKFSIGDLSQNSRCTLPWIFQHPVKIEHAIHIKYISCNIHIHCIAECLSEIRFKLGPGDEKSLMKAD